MAGNLSYLSEISKTTEEGSPMRIRMVLLALLMLIGGAALAQQSMQQPMIASPEEAKFASSPSFPDCFHYAVVRGDPKGSGSVMLIRMSSGCVVPSHWHSANEQLTFTSGTGQVLMKGEQPQTVSAGTYHYVPAKHVHQVTCKDNCTFYRMIDGPTDIHYVDAAGNEIATNAALAAFGENPGTAVAQK
jgi:quercetin dioxygenase-like cupin family protein